MADVRVTLNNPLPSSGSSPITAVEYRVAGGVPADSGLTSGTSFLGSFVVPAASDLDIQIRQQNATQYSVWSSVKNTAAVITATVPVGMTPLYNTQSIDDTTDFATKVAKTNFTSTGGTIDSAVVEATGDAIEITSSLATDNTAGYDVLVTDSLGNTANFLADEITVEAMYTAEAISGGTIEITSVSTLPAPGVSLVPAIVVSSVDQLATVGNARDAMDGTPVALLAPATPTGFTTLGATLTGVDDLVVLYSGTEPVNTYSWEADGVPISGATGLTFVITASEQDTDVTFLVKPGTGTAVESSPIAIPAAGATALTGTMLVSDTSTGDTFTAVDLSAATATEVMYIVCMYDAAAANRYISAIDVGGNSATLIQESSQTVSRAKGSIWSFVMPADLSPDVTITESSPVGETALYFWAVSAPATVQTSAAGQTDGNAAFSTAAVNVLDEDLVLAGGTEDRATGGQVLTGLTDITYVDVTSATNTTGSGKFEATATAEPHTVTCTMDGNGHSCCVAVNLRTT